MNKKKNVRVEQKDFPFSEDDAAAMRMAETLLRSWMRDIDDRLFNEGYELRDGILYDRKSCVQVDQETYWKRRKERGLRS